MKRSRSCRPAVTWAVVLAALGLTLVSCSKPSFTTAPAAPSFTQNFGTVSVDPNSTTLVADGADCISDTLWLSVGIRQTYHEVCYGSRGLFCYSGALDLPPVCDARYWTSSGVSLGTSEGLSVGVVDAREYVMTGMPLPCRIHIPASIRDAAIAQGESFFFADLSLNAYRLEHCYSFVYPVGSARGEFQGKTGTCRLKLTI